MKKSDRVMLSAAAGLLLFAFRAAAMVFYVNAANPAPTPPFTSWDTAATNIQDAIDLTSASDTVLVTNGVYAYGGLIMAGDLLNRVALTNPITVQSVNGPWVTTILGAGATNGPDAVRCAWLTNGAALTGFTLMAGATRTSGDAGSLESGGGVWCASSNALVGNCVIASNTAYEYGSGAYQGTVTTSLIASNSAVITTHGGAYQTVLNNCTIVGNSGYGVASPLAMTNCIIYFNSFANFSISGSAFSHCCTTPAMAGTGNFTTAPQLMVDNVHLATNSPCLGAGVGNPTGTDLFGNAWSSPPSVGCTEWSSAPVAVTAPTTQFPMTGGTAISVNVAGQPPFTCWWSKDGLLVQPDANHTGVSTPTLLINNFALSDAGTYQVVVSNSFGMTTSFVSQVSAHCVASGGASLPPYSDWASAATNIQDAVNVAQAGDIVLVTNGLYAFGALVTDRNQSNRVALMQPVMVQSVNGPWVTTIQGGNGTNGAPPTRCAWMTNGAALAGFTLLGGGTVSSVNNGAGVCAATNAIIENCIICSNVAMGWASATYLGVFRNCALFDNGTTFLGTLFNCTFSGNAGGTSSSTLTNCILYSNSGVGYDYFTLMSYCCTYPLPTRGINNITNPPQLFSDHVHLFANSPCIGAGTNLGSSTDIEGQPWLNPPSIGCSEAVTVPLVGPPILQFANTQAGFTITAAITGSSPLGCWWLENGIPIQSGGQSISAQAATFTATTLSQSQAGAYQLVVSNAFGVVTSAVAQVVMHCVDAAGTNSVAPHLTWETAATNIQDAITTAATGEIVLVTNGIYASGGISMDGVFTNRVSVNKAILVQSVNGPGATVIQGAWDPASTNGPGAVRCVWMTNNAVLSGFTIQGGATRANGYGFDYIGGGILGRTNSLVVNCVISSNMAALDGGGSAWATLLDCLLISNGALGAGGGAYQCSLKNCLITSNYALWAGGATAYCQLTNCAVTQNSAGTEAGGVYYGTLDNCTVTRNISSSYNDGGGAYNSTCVNSIVYGNGEANSLGTASNYYACTFSYCCTAPAASGTGNIAADPLLLPDGLHLSLTSPCIGAGNSAAVSGTDIDGQPWNNPPSIGCDEWKPAPVFAGQVSFQLGPPQHALTTSTPIAGAPPFSCLWTKNGTPVQNNGHYANEGATNFTINNFELDDAGTYQVVVTNAYGAVTSAIVPLVIHAVNSGATNPVPPFATWATAATNIQNAINASALGDFVLVTNGIYATGGMAVNGTMTNRVALNKAVTVTSVNGYNVTTIQGAWSPGVTAFGIGPQAVRCAYLADGAVLNGFTLCHGATLATGDSSLGGPLESGGGIYCVSANSVASACVLSNNSAYYGGGVANGTLNNSLVIRNIGEYGGGAYAAMLNNCTVINNQVGSPGSGAVDLGPSGSKGAVRNSIILTNYNIGVGIYNFYPYSGAGISYCCTAPSLSGNGNIDANPQFVGFPHILTTSPCYGAGSATYATGCDLDGNPWNNPPSMGCSEVFAASLIGPISVGVGSASTNLLVNRQGVYSGIINGRASWAQWSFGDGTTVSNLGVTGFHAWTNAGAYTVTFTAYNTDNAAGVSTNLIIQVAPLVAPQLQALITLTNGIQFQFGGQTTANYSVQFTTNVAPPITWQNLGTVSNNALGTVQISDTAATNTTRFYRVLVQ